MQEILRVGGRAVDQLDIQAGRPSVPAVITAAGRAGEDAFIEFFVATLRNPLTRRAHVNAVIRFTNWIEATAGVLDIRDLQAWHVATYIEFMLQEKLRPPTVKQALSAIRQLCDFLVVRQILPTNPATSVKAPKHVTRRGLTPVLLPEETRAILDAIDISTIKGHRRRQKMDICFGHSPVARLRQVCPIDRSWKATCGRLSINGVGPGASSGLSTNIRSARSASRRTLKTAGSWRSPSK